MLILKNILEFFLPKITDLIGIFSTVLFNYNITDKSFFKIYVMIDFVKLVNYIIQYYKKVSFFQNGSLLLSKQNT